MHEISEVGEQRPIPRRALLPWAMLALIGLGQGCSPVQDNYRTLNISGVNYRFPSTHVRNMLKPGQGETFVRLIPPNQPFMLIYSQNNYRNNQQGDNIPTISYVNDVPGDFNVIETSSGFVICEPGSRRYNCGLRVEDNGIRWSVLFNQSEVYQSSIIRNTAARIISEYRESNADRS